MEKNKSMDNLGTELSDQELLDIVGGFTEVVEPFSTKPTPKYGIVPKPYYGIIAYYGILPLYGIFPQPKE